MGDSLPPPAEFNLVDSFARHSGGDVELVLADPKVTDVPESAYGELVRGREVVRTRLERDSHGGNDRFVLRVERGRVDDGIWRLRLTDGAGFVQPLNARLLVQGRRPAVLLWGAKGEPVIVPRRDHGARRAAALVSPAVDAAVGQLPPETAARVRQALRGTARRVVKAVGSK